MPPALTPQEARFLAFIASGDTIPEIAGRMYTSQREVEKISTKVKVKLGARSLPQAVLAAHAIGYISVPDDEGVVVAQSPFAEGAS